MLMAVAAELNVDGRHGTGCSRPLLAPGGLFVLPRMETWGFLTGGAAV